MQKTIPKIFFLTILFFGLFGLAKSSLAADLCVTPTGSGTKTGADWNNAADWSSLTFVRGDTYYLAGGSDVYASRVMDTPASEALIITIKKATTASHVIDTGWIDSYGTEQALFENFQTVIKTPYWVIDGADGCGALNAECMDGNDPLKYGFKFYMTDEKCAEKFAICDPTETSEQNLTVFGYHTADVSHITLKHAALVTCDDSYDCVCATGFFNYGRNYPTLTQSITVQNNYFEWFQNAAAFYVTRDALFENNYVYKDKSLSDHCHGEMLNARGSVGLTIRNNYFKDVLTYALGVHDYAPVNNVSIPNQDILFYNNIIDGGTTTAIVGSASGGYKDIIWNMKVFNNTFYNVVAASYGAVWSGELSDPVDTTKWSHTYNNLFYNIQGAAGARMTNAGYAGLVHDYNAYVYCSQHTDEEHEILEPSNISPVVSAATGDFRLFDTSIAKDVGTSAVSGIVLNDYTDTTRPQGSTWDIGAYEYVGAVSDTTPPAAPSGLAVN